MASVLISVTLSFEPVVRITSYPEKQGQCDIWVTMVYLPQVFSGTHLLTNLKRRMNTLNMHVKHLAQDLELQL